MDPKENQDDMLSDSRPLANVLASIVWLEANCDSVSSGGGNTSLREYGNAANIWVGVDIKYRRDYSMMRWSTWILCDI